METYKNLAGNSGIAAYEIGDDFMIIRYHDGDEYVYNYESAGREHIEEMKLLAITGRGLNTYINQNVREDYSAKLK